MGKFVLLFLLENLKKFPLHCSGGKLNWPHERYGTIRASQIELRNRINYSSHLALRIEKMVEQNRTFSDSIYVFHAPDCKSFWCKKFTITRDIFFCSFFFLLKAAWDCISHTARITRGTTLLSGSDICSPESHSPRSPVSTVDNSEDFYRRALPKINLLSISTAVENFWGNYWFPFLTISGHLRQRNAKIKFLGKATSHINWFSKNVDTHKNTYA